MKTKTNTEISFSFWLTLFYSIPLLALTDRRTDRQTDGGTNLSWLCWLHPDGFLQVYPGCAGRTLTGSSRLILVVLAAPWRVFPGKTAPTRMTTSHQQYTLHLQNATSTRHPTWQIRLFTLPIARSNDTHRLNDKPCQHQMPPILRVPKLPQDESHVCDQNHHNNQPLCQRLTFLVGKKSSSDVRFHIQLMSEGAEDLWHKTCATADLRHPCHTRAIAQHYTQCNDQCCYAIECVQMPMALDDHDDRDCHNNCDMSTCT